MKRVALALLALLVAIAGVMTWQHLRYLGIRRDVVEDRQPILHSSDAFHVVTFLDVEDEADVLPGLRRLRDAIAGVDADALLVYAGQAAFTRESSQLGPRAWDAVAMVQYASRGAYDAAAASPPYREALASYRDHYSHGMKRSRPISLLLPQILLALRTADILRGNWRVPDLVENTGAAPPAALADLEAARSRLLRLEPVNSQAVVVFNLILSGSAEQRAADSSYGRKMLTRMAGLAHGPMHMGRAVTIEGDARFENVAIVYYPGVGYFSRLMGSRFFQGIIGDKQLGDTQAVLTVPVLTQL